MTYISVQLRHEVVERAGNCCEYCLLSQDNIFFRFEIDHVVAQKHGGETVLENLCLSCPDCNAYKGSDLTSIDPETNEVVRLFNPRTQNWSDHFNLDGPVIGPLSAKDGLLSNSSI